MNNPVTPASWHCKGLCKSLVLFYMFHVNNDKKQQQKQHLTWSIKVFIPENAFENESHLVSTSTW